MASSCMDLLLFRQHTDRSGNLRLPDRREVQLVGCVVVVDCDGDYVVAAVYWERGYVKRQIKADNPQPNRRS